MEYWKNMKEKAAKSLAHITKHEPPEDEGGVKHHLAMVISHGDCHEKAEAFAEAAEWLFANLMCKKISAKE